MIVAKLQPHDPNSSIWRWAAGRAFLLTLQLGFMLFAGLWAQAQTLTVLYAFKGHGDGMFPSGVVFRESTGTLYDVTFRGGSFDYGTVFAVDAHRKETVLHSFWGGDGANPETALIQDDSGNLYGTTYDGGALEGGNCVHGCGTVFKLDKTGKLTVLYAFSGGADGGNPAAGLIRDREGNLYGTTTDGGDLGCTGSGYGCGVVFKLDSNGNETVLHAFADWPGDGAQPSGGLIRDKAGNFYGVTTYGGASQAADWGTVYKLDPTGKETLLYSFTGGTDGGMPDGTLVRDAEGNLYGVADINGDPRCQCGVVFKVDMTGKETVLYSFQGSPNGSQPLGGVIRDSVGNLYGATQFGGSGSGCGSLGCGIVFKLDTSGNETVLHSFTEGSDGAFPGGLALDKSGNLYGNAANGGGSSCGRYAQSGCGVVFKLTP